jgi:hypothetical protein
LIFLGHKVGEDHVKPVDAKVQAINDFPVPTYKRQLMRILGVACYYRKFCKHLSVIAEPLTILLIIIRKVSYLFGTMRTRLHLNDYKPY